LVHSLRRSVGNISILLSMFGLILVSFSSVVLQPYTVVESLRVDSSRVHVDERVVLPRGSEKVYAFDSLVKNGSLIEVSLLSESGTGPYRFRIEDIILNYTVLSWDRIRSNPFYWTPPYITIFHFIFDNPYATTANFSLVIKAYYPKHVEYQNVTLYRPMLDGSYAYLGIGLITLAIILDLTVLGYEEIQNYKKKLEEKLQNYPTQTSFQ